MIEKKKFLKGVSLGLACAVVTAGIGVAAFAATKNGDDNNTVTSSSAEKKKADNIAAEKNETVYVLANADGSVKKIIVSDWIKNSLKSSTLADKTELDGIKNVKGDESYVMNSDNMSVWNADGSDIYYQGTVSKALPVDLRLTYKLDGKEISAENIAGKSGKVTIRFDYKNNQYAEAVIDGKKEKINVPFVMLTGVLLDNAKFRNVEISNGKIINDGSRIAAVGFALPGMAENLKLTDSEIDIPDYVEITADVTDFKLSSTMTLATNSVFNNIDTEKLNSLDGIKASVGQLTSAMSKLLDGSSQLYGGLTELLNKSGELISGINKLAAGSNELSAGTAALNEGLKTLVSNNDKLNGGAKQVFDTLLKTVTSQVKAGGVDIPDLTVENYKTVLNSVITDSNLIKMADGKINEQLKSVGVPENYYTAVKVMLINRINGGKTQQAAMAEIQDALTSAVTVNTVAANANIAPDTAVYTALKAQGTDDNAAGLIAKLCTYLAAVNGNTPQENITAASQMAANANEVVSAAADKGAQAKINAFCLAQPEIKAAKSQITDAVASLDSYNEFYQGVLGYTAGAEQAYDGSEKLNSGAAALNSGIGELQAGGSKLVSGVQQLSDGAKRLQDGLKEFNEKGISRITELANGDLPGIVTRLKATVDVSKSYQSFAGIADGTDGSVKFIYKTDEIAVK